MSFSGNALPNAPLHGGQHHIVTCVALCGGHLAHRLAVAAIQRKCRAHSLAAVAAELEAVRTPALVAGIPRDPPIMSALPPNEAALDAYLRTLERGRLEQEFLPARLVQQAVQSWARAAEI